LSREEFGETAALRYATLVAQALRDIGEDPERHEFMIEGARTYHLEFSRKRVSGRRVKDPRYFLIYRRRGDLVEVARAARSGRLPAGMKRLPADDKDRRRHRAAELESWQKSAGDKDRQRYMCGWRSQGCEIFVSFVSC
jgi:hypothetical protein